MVQLSPPCGGVSRNKKGIVINGILNLSPPTWGRAETASTERKRDDQSSLLPTKNFHPRISVNTRPSGIFLTE